MIRIFGFNFSAIAFLLKHKKLWWYCVIPLFISLVLMSALVYFVFVTFDSFLSFEPLPIEENAGFFKGIWNDTLNFLRGGVAGVFKWIAFIITAMLVLWYGYSIIASIVMLPFLELLSNEVEKELRGSQFDNPWYAGLLSSFLFSLAFTVLKLFFLLLGLIFSFIFPPYVFVNFVIMAWFCSMESLDLCMSRHLFSVKKKLSFLFSCKFDLVYLGSFSAFILLLPFIGILQPILASVSGTLYFVKKTPEFGIKEEHLKLLTGDNKNG